MYNFSALIDDGLAADMEGKIDICSRLMMGNMEINDETDGRRIADLTGEQLEKFRNSLIRNNKKIVLVNCGEPVANREYYKETFRKGHLLGIENMNVKVGNEDKPEEAFMEGFKAVCEIGASYGVGVLLENGSRTFLSSDKAVGQFFERAGNQYAGLIYNPLEFARLKSHPFFHMFYNSRRKNDIRFLRVNDGLFLDGAPSLPGEGNAEIKELASILLSRGFKGYFSFVPYMENMDFYKYSEVIDIFKRLLMEM